jgi:hypothetical protein
MRMALTREQNGSVAPAKGACFAAFALAFALVLAGCSAPKARSEHDATVDFSRFKTFAVLALTTAGPGAAHGERLQTGRTRQRRLHCASARRITAAH